MAHRGLADRSGPRQPGGYRGGVDDEIVVRPGVVIRSAELEWAFSPSGGPGGQHANRSHTRVELRFAIATSESLDAEIKRRLGRELDDPVVVVVDETRSQWRNRTIALRRLRERLDEALRPRAKRRATKPSRSSQRRRVADKRRRSELKRSRQKPNADD